MSKEDQGETTEAPTVTVEELRALRSVTWFGSLASADEGAAR